MGTAAFECEAGELWTGVVGAVEGAEERGWYDSPVSGECTAGEAGGCRVSMRPICGDARGSWGAMGESAVSMRPICGDAPGSWGVMGERAMSYWLDSVVSVRLCTDVLSMLRPELIL